MQKKTVTDTTKLLLGAGVGFSLFWLTSHPKSKIKRNLPTKQYKKVSLLPNIRYYHHDTIYHFHHWLILAACYLPLMKYKKARRSQLLHGLFLGSILQGLLYKDRFHFKYPKITSVTDEITQAPLIESSLAVK